MKITTNWINVIDGVPEKVQVIVEDEGFRDALYYPTVAELDAAAAGGDLDRDAQARLDGWKAAIAQPPPIPEPPTEEAVLADIVSLEERRAALDEELAEKNAVLAVIVAKTDLDPVVVQPGPITKG